MTVSFQKSEGKIKDNVNNGAIFGHRFLLYNKHKTTHNKKILLHRT